jgi:hypothetical protein
MFRKRLLGSIDAAYFGCTSCGHVQTEPPYWLDRAYHDLNFRRDTGMVDRCLWAAKTTVALAHRLGIGGDRVCLDWGAGTGLFVRMCRDHGMNFFYHDRYAENIFARGFEFTSGEREDIALITAFEVLEHFPNPVNDFLELAKLQPDYMLISTKLYWGFGRDWWYFTDDGQHVAVYTRTSLELLARQHGFSLMTDGSHLHLLTKRRLRRGMLRSCFKSRDRLSARYRKCHGSRIFSDFELVRKESGEDQS